MLGDIRQDLREMFRRESVHPVGPKAIKRQNPLGRPRRPKREPAPLCLASAGETRKRFMRELAEFVAAYRAASVRLRAGELGVQFPAFSFPPPRTFVAGAPGP